MHCKEEVVPNCRKQLPYKRLSLKDALTQRGSSFNRHLIVALLLEEFNGERFNALVEKKEILTSTHFVFELISRMRVEGDRRVEIYTNIVGLLVTRICVAL